MILRKPDNPADSGISPGSRTERGSQGRFAMATQPRRRLALIVAPALCALGIVGIGATSAHADDTVHLSGDVVTNLDRVTPQSAVPSNMHMAIGVQLRRPDPQGEA